MSSKKRRDEVRYATWTMVSITTTYLCCSSLSLFISVMENVFPQNSLLFNEDGSSTRFYTLASDAVSILVAVNSLLRLFVYLLCSPSLREQLLTEFPIFNCCRWGEKKLDGAEEKFTPYQPTLLGTPAAL
ncbi:unnamed protein product [Nippostrongylus brasiliensis]|uniref:G_PROTEIN_RECEP_F1_2 domain-containing protein n=1 Tax=Nippostrongylus brasiliensis TaxID=27835 RepID=A0A0N4YYV7_NIPBR|nr:unnamed protein product [Nippostrongylus brasiliensis]